MWSERPSVDILLQSPCRDCDKRTKPKTCETGCELWIAYKDKKTQLEKQKEFRKEVDKLFASKYNKKRK